MVNAKITADAFWKTSREARKWSEKAEEDKDRGDFHKRRAAQKVHWNSAGTMVASCSRGKDRNVYVCKVDNDGLRKHTGAVNCKGHKEAVYSIAWHPLPKHPDVLASCSWDKTVRLWEASKGRCLHTIEGFGQLLNIQWSPNGKFITVSDEEGTLTIIDLKTRKTIASRQISHSSIPTFRWTPDNKFILVGKRDGLIEIVTAPNLERVHTFRSHLGPVYSIVFNPSGEHFATGGADGLVTMWQTRNLIQVFGMARFDSPCRCVDFSCDGQVLVAASEDPFLDFTWVGDPEKGSVGKTFFKQEMDAGFNSVAWNPKLPLLAYASEDRDQGVVVWGFRSTTKKKSR